MKHDFLSKFDFGLKTIYSNFINIKEKGKGGENWVHPAIKNTDMLALEVHFKGNIAVLEDLGFIPQTSEKGNAYGNINIRGLKKLASCDAVTSLTYGNSFRPFLDTSVTEINARKSSGQNYVWELDQDTEKFNGNLGEGVVIGIIDTGINHGHHDFTQHKDPSKTRIKRIWDQGLNKKDSDKQPEIDFLNGNETYGVEFHDTDIENGIRHKDCDGHGTHVASTAAGNGWSTTKYIGVAPKADLVIVKLIYLENEPEDRHGAQISYNQRLKDAVTYIIETAKTIKNDENPAVVINFSAGSGESDPHDGLAEIEKWLSQEFQDTKGRVFVAAAGNGAGFRLHAELTIPDTGNIEIPFKLIDARTKLISRIGCELQENGQPLRIDIFYRSDPIGFEEDTLDVQVKFPEKNSFENVLTYSQPARSKPFDGGKVYEIDNSQAHTRDLQGNTVYRKHISFTVTPHKNKHRSGDYYIKLIGKKGIKAHIWCKKISEKQLFKIGSIDDSLKQYIKITDNNTVATPASARNIISVAAYDDQNPTKKNIDTKSSRGPLVSYSDKDPIAEKPEISAPGVDIRAAGHFFRVADDFINLLHIKAYVPMSGTSMSAPHITGVVALMLAKNKDLTVEEIIKILKSEARDQSLDSHIYGGGKVDAYKSVEKVPQP